MLERSFDTFSMLSRLSKIATALEEMVGALAPAALSGADAVAALDGFERLARLAEAGRLSALARIEQTRVWQGRGHASAAHWAADRTGVTLGHAVGALTTARALSKLPQTRASLVSGDLSPQQTEQIALAARENPASEADLLTAARTMSASELRDRCRMVRVAAAGDEAHTRIHRTRYLRHRIDDLDGASIVTLRTTAEQAAPLIAYCKADADRRAAMARRDGTTEPFEAHLADAVCALPSKLDVPSGSAVGTEAGAPGDAAQLAPHARRRAKDRAVRAVVYVHADVTAWERGSAEPGERCEISGVGPTTVAAARRMAAQPGGMLKLAIHNEGNVTGVVNLGRYIPASIDAALKARDVRCVVRGCTRVRGLERDHRTPFTEGGPTSLANLDRPCAYHHYLKTHLGWKIAGEPPNCEMVPPEPLAHAPP